MNKRNRKSAEKRQLTKPGKKIHRHRRKFQHHKSDEGDSSNKTGVKSNSLFEGVFTVGGKGIGYVRERGADKDMSIEIEQKNWNTALHGDTVKVKITKGKSKDGLLKGEIKDIIFRAKSGFAGTLEDSKNGYELKASDPKLYTTITIPKDKAHGAKIGQKVFVLIKKWNDPNKNPEGEVEEVLGVPGDNNAEMRAIALEKGFSQNFPPLVIKEAEALRKKGVSEEEISMRRDFRKITTFTIDPSDAKDF